MSDTVMVISRAMHLASCLLVFALEAFAIFIPATLRSAGRRRLRAIWWWTVTLLVLSGVAWFVWVAMQLTESPMTLAKAQVVLSRTHFGRLWKLRGVLAIVAIILHLVPDVRLIRFTRIGCGAALLGSLAWAGHGQLGASWRGVHLTNDLIHLLVAGFWPMGLIPLALLLFDRSVESKDARQLLVGFSRMSVICVCLLIGSGALNTALTLEQVADLVTTRYGVVLIGKIGLVAMIVGIGAINRRAVAMKQTASIRSRVILEIALAAVVIAATAWLGTLDP